MCTLGETLKALQLAIVNLNKAKAHLDEHARGGLPDTEDCCIIQTAKLKLMQREVWYEYKEFHYNPDNLDDPLFCEGCREYYEEFKYIVQYTHDDFEAARDPLCKCFEVGN